MARPKGTEYRDKRGLMLMARLIVEGVAKNPWAATEYAAKHCRGNASDAITRDAIRRRLRRKYVESREALERKAKESIRFELDNGIPRLANEMALQQERADADKKRLLALIDGDRDLEEIILSHTPLEPGMLLELLPEMLNRLSHKWIEQ